MNKPPSRPSNIIVPSYQVPNPEVYQPRDYQKPFLRALTQRDPATGEHEYTRFLLLWHRRGGKDVTGMAGAAIDILVNHADEPIVAVALAGTSQKHGGNILWDNWTNEGYKYTDVFPRESIARTDARDYTIHFKNGSIFKILTTLDHNVLRGLNPKLVYISEFDFIPEMAIAWRRSIIPILNQNGGKAIITSTPDGAKHMYRMYLRNRKAPKWFVDLRTPLQTLHEGKRTLTDEQIEAMRRDGMTEADVRQEIWLDFFAEHGGTIYEHEFRRIREEGRITSVPYDSALPVHTTWDIGMDDDTSIWFFQITPGGQWRWIDFYANNRQQAEHYFNFLHTKPYRYGHHIAPHDAFHRTIHSQESFIRRARNHNVHFTRATNASVQDGINASRNVLDKSVFDAKKTFEGVECLKGYRRRLSNRVDQFGERILSNEIDANGMQHAADAFRMAAVSRQRLEGNLILVYDEHNPYTHPRHQQAEMHGLPKNVINQYSPF